MSKCIPTLVCLVAVMVVAGCGSSVSNSKSSNNGGLSLDPSVGTPGTPGQGGIPNPGTAPAPSLAGNWQMVININGGQVGPMQLSVSGSDGSYTSDFFTEVFYQSGQAHFIYQNFALVGPFQSGQSVVSGDHYVDWDNGQVNGTFTMTLLGGGSAVLGDG